MKKIKVLVGCENSGAIRDAFNARPEFDAMSCDLLPTQKPGPHYQGDLRDILGDGWDLLIAHPTCTYLTCSAEWAYGDGPYHQKVQPGTLVGAARRQAREEALDFVRLLFDAPIRHKAIENPRGVISTRIRPASQYIQPFDFGDDASKITGLWLDELPTLVPTQRVPGRLVEWPKGSGKMVERWSNQTDSGQNKLTPSADRWLIRSKTYQGWADAMAQQWGDYLIDLYINSKAA